MTRNGFSLVADGKPKKKIHSRHAKALFRYTLLKIPRLKWLAGITYLIPNNIIIPYLADDLFWALYKRT